MIDHIEITITYLEMGKAPSDRLAPAPPGTTPVLRPLLDPRVEDYRRLYNAVGEKWFWWERRVLPDAELERILGEPGREVLVLEEGGEQAGFAELEHQEGGRALQVIYFGLVPAFIGRGLGGWFLSRVIDHAWSAAPRRVWLHTCTLDHPAALSVYRKAGFVPFKTDTRSIPDPRFSGLF